MRHNYFLKAVFTFLLCGFFSMSFAADWYISATGSDDLPNDGSIGAPWKSFTKAQTAAAAADVIHVSGLIDFSLEPSLVQPVGVAITKNLTIQGTSNATDGFDGKSLTRFFSNTTFGLTLKNLKLVNGYSGNNNGGAIINTGAGNLNCENVIFDSNKTGMNPPLPAAATNKTGAAIHFDNATGSTFKKCVFSNNEASKAGAVYITAWIANSTILFEGCAFLSNTAKESFGGSALYIRANTSANTTCNVVNCTFKGNLVNTIANGGTVYFGAKSPATTNVNIVNCTITENKTVGSATNGAGVYFLNTTAGGCWGNLYVSNSIIEGNTTTAGAFSDLCVGAISPTTAGGGSASVPGYIKVQNSIIGAAPTAAANVPVATNIAASPSYNLLVTNTSTSNDFVAKLVAFNTSNNSYALHVGSSAIAYGNSAFLTGLTPTVTTDQLGNVRTVGATNTAGSIETSAVATTTPNAPTSLLATAGTGQISVAFTYGVTGGSAITNYKYSIDGGATYTACSPVDIISPIVITGLSNIAYSVMLKAVNENGESVASTASNSVTPPTAPTAPTALVATAADAQISIAFTEGLPGSSPITNYKYSTDGGTTFTACAPAQTISPILITGLTNGTAYSMKIRAINANGDGKSSSLIVSTPGTPSAPTDIVATHGNTQISVAFTASATDGGFAISNYEYSTDGGTTYIACAPAQTTSPIVITGLTNGTAYTALLRAVNTNGAGAASVASNSVTPSVVSGLKNVDNQSISIFRNSNNQIVVTNSSIKSGMISICNSIGQIIVSSPINGAKTTINKSLSKGVYLIMVNIDGNISTKKVILN